MSIEVIIAAYAAACGLSLGYIIGSQLGYVKGFDEGLRTRVSFELLSFDPEEE